MTQEQQLWVELRRYLLADAAQSEAEGCAASSRRRAGIRLAKAIERVYLTDGQSIDDHASNQIRAASRQGSRPSSEASRSPSRSETGSLFLARGGAYKA